MSLKFWVGVAILTMDGANTVELFTGWWDSENNARGGFVKIALEKNPGKALADFKVYDATSSVMSGIPNV